MISFGSMEFQTMGTAYSTQQKTGNFWINRIYRKCVKQHFDEDGVKVRFDMFPRKGTVMIVLGVRKVWNQWELYLLFT
jgi:hypothetical protein